jgi:hypothetical protein
LPIWWKQFALASAGSTDSPTPVMRYLFLLIRSSSGQSLGGLPENPPKYAQLPTKTAAAGSRIIFIRQGNHVQLGADAEHGALFLVTRHCPLESVGKRIGSLMQMQM